MSRKTSQRYVEAPETLAASFKVSGNVSEAATSLLGQNCERLSLGDMGLGFRLDLGSGLVHIPANHITEQCLQLAASSQLCK